MHVEALCSNFAYMSGTKGLVCYLALKLRDAQTEKSEAVISLRYFAHRHVVLGTMYND